MVLEGEKYQSAAAPYVEENVLVYDKFAEIISWLEESMQPFYASFGLDGVSRMAEQGAPGLRKTANRRDDVVEKTVEKMLKGKAALRSQEAPEGVQIAGKILREDRDRFPTGHSGPGASQG